MYKLKIFSVALSIIVLTLFFSNPSEFSFLNRLADDYVGMHRGSKISQEQLLEVGASQRTSYIIFSIYSYRFGKLEVFYFGIANKIIFVGSGFASKKNEPKVVMKKRKLHFTDS